MSNGKHLLKWFMSSTDPNHHFSRKTKVHLSKKYKFTSYKLKLTLNYSPGKMEFHNCHGAQGEECVFISLCCFHWSEAGPGKVAHCSAPPGESEGAWIVECKARTTYSKFQASQSYKPRACLTTNKQISKTTTTTDHHGLTSISKIQESRSD